MFWEFNNKNNRKILTPAIDSQCQIDRFSTQTPPDPWWSNIRHVRLKFHIGYNESHFLPRFDCSHSSFRNIGYHLNFLNTSTSSTIPELTLFCSVGRADCWLDDCVTVTASSTISGGDNCSTGFTTGLVWKYIIIGWEIKDQSRFESANWLKPHRFPLCVNSNVCTNRLQKVIWFSCCGRLDLRALTTTKKSNWGLLELQHVTDQIPKQWNTFPVTIIAPRDSSLWGALPVTMLRRELCSVYWVSALPHL